MTKNTYTINKKILFNYKECHLYSITSNTREPLGSNPSWLLLFLIKNNGNAVSLEEISAYFMEKGRVVNSTTAIQYISKIRKALKSLGEHTTVIATIKGGGYYIPGYIDISASPPLCIDSIDKEKVVATDISADVLAIDTESDVVNLPRGKSMPLLKLLLLVPFIIFCVTLVWLLLPAHFDHVKYRKIQILNGCTIYADHDIPEKGSKIEKSIFNEKDISCKNKPYVYLTYFEYSDNYSLFLCNVPIDDKRVKNICSSILRLSND